MSQRSTISRRKFLTAAAFSPALVLPGKTCWGDTIQEDDPVTFRFAVTSDIHFPGNHDGWPYPGNTQVIQQRRFTRMLQWVRRYCTQSPYNRLDVLAVNGDMTDRGTPDELVPFCETMDHELPPETMRVLTLANHELFGGSQTYWEETCRMPMCHHQVIGGYHFITLSPVNTEFYDGLFKGQIDWVAEQLKIAADDDPNRPIFFFQHYPIALPEARDPNEPRQWLYGRATVRCHANNWGLTDLYELFQQYPQIVDFSGDSHYPLCDPGSVWQDRFSAFGTGTLCYTKLLGSPYDETPVGRFDYAQFYVAEIHESGAIELKLADLRTETFLDYSYLIPAPGHPESYLHTDARIKDYPLPVWEKGAFIRVAGVTQTEGLTKNGGEFRFEQTKNLNQTQSYRAQFYEIGQEEPVAEQYLWSEFYRRPMPETIEFTENRLKSGTRYRLTITPISFFGGEGKPLSLEFTTK